MFHKHGFIIKIKAVSIINNYLQIVAIFYYAIRKTDKEKIPFIFNFGIASSSKSENVTWRMLPAMTAQKTPQCKNWVA